MAVAMFDAGIAPFHARAFSVRFSSMSTVLPEATTGSRSVGSSPFNL